MAGPFPGMDPWLEARGIFPDVHDSLIAYLRETLNERLPRGFKAKIANRVWIETSRDRIVEPDVSIVRGSSRTGSSPTQTTAVLPEPLISPEVHPWIVMIPQEEMVERLVEVWSIETEPRLVTAIEILSRINKTAGESGQIAYRRKQAELVEQGVNLVEMDLLRFGQHSTRIPPDRLREVSIPMVYHICVTRGLHPERLEVYPVALPDRLPSVSIPIQLGLDIVIDLQPLLDRVYETGKYHEEINYRQPCDPPLNAEHTSWAEAVIAGWQPEIGT